MFQFEIFLGSKISIPDSSELWIQHHINKWKTLKILFGMCFSFSFSFFFLIFPWNSSIYIWYCRFYDKHWRSNDGISFLIFIVANINIMFLAFILCWCMSHANSHKMEYNYWRLHCDQVKLIFQFKKLLRKWQQYNQAIQFHLWRKWYWKWFQSCSIETII